MATIYFGTRRLVVANYLSDERMAEADAILGYETGSDITSFINNFLAEEDDFTAYIYGNNYSAIMDEIESNFKLVLAAGGYISDITGKKLFIFRRNTWDLPKGKLEKGETPKQAALREVEEETGLNELSITKELDSTYHIYEEKGVLILKQTYWFAMSVGATHEGTPQLEEGITQIKWLDKAELDQVYENTFPSIVDVIENED